MPPVLSSLSECVKSMQLFLLLLIRPAIVVGSRKPDFVYDHRLQYSTRVPSLKNTSRESSGSIKQFKMAFPRPKQ
ncbi:hypothetical protein GGR52DRAFT_353024 [Hypoxylon sp. FL1284]|nr:hypothetical protein GGR52DRAFT_353024 [Hypoxylon sp. FL1284]